MKLLLLFTACGLLAASALSQALPGDPLSSPGLRLDAGDSPSPSPGKKEKKGKGEATPAPSPTIINAKDEMTYDEKSRVAVFTGSYYGVVVVDPQFTLTCDKLTVYMRKTGETGNVTGSGGKVEAGGKGTSTGKAGGKGAAGSHAAHAATPAQTPRAAAGQGRSARGGASPAPGDQKGGGVKRAIAEGTRERPIVIVQDKPATDGGEPQRNVGIAEKADYDADTGNVFLTGWPRVSQGINTQIATAENTIMIMNRDGGTMHTIGPSKSSITETKAKESPSPTPTPADSQSLNPHL